MLDSDRALENADTLRVLIEDGLDVFSGPKGILFEPNLKVRIKDGNERSGLLARTLRNGQEVCLVFRGKKLDS